MRLLKRIQHHLVAEISGRVFERRAARAIVLKEDEILLLYTQRYNDYSFPGGGVDAEEDLIIGLKRELTEETGASNINDIKEFGYIDEYRPHYRPDFDLVHMLSYFYTCTIDSELGKHKMEQYEIDNGMRVQWINIFDAILHNKKVISSQEASMGLSIQRETLVLEIVAKELVSRRNITQG
jgi:8-oxo-dGTP pyrophosphatase MutT (NUDIX family)